MTRPRNIVIEWCDAEKMLALARSRGWSADSTESVLDHVREDEADAWREFASVTKARAWARRNRSLDFWNEPTLAVYEWPDSRRLSWQRECVQRERYVGDGCGWHDLLGVES